MNRMPKNARVLETLGESIYRDENGNIHIKNKVLIEKSMEFGNDTSLINALRNITDDYGNKRFIEGNITTNEITGVTFTYAKWSLSGTHLMMVLAGNISNGTTLSFATWSTLNNLPDFIKNKIVPTFDDIVEIKYVHAYKSDWTGQDIGFVLVKNASGVSIVETSTPTLDYDGQFRVQFDLLIDTD